MAKKETNKKANIAKEENIKDMTLDTENSENTILDVENKESDIISKAVEDQEQDEKPTITVEEKVENEDSQPAKQNSVNKVKTAKRKISKLFGYYWNGQQMD